MSSMTSLDEGSKEFLEIAVVKRGKDRRSFVKPIFKKDRESFKDELRDSFKGRLILPLSKAFQFNQKQYTIRQCLPYAERLKLLVSFGSD